MVSSKNLFYVDNWRKNAPAPKQGQFVNDLEKLTRWHSEGQGFVNILPSALERNDEQWRIIHHFRDALAETRGRFVSIHGMELYAELTNNLTETIRVETLIYKLADKYPCLAPTKKEVKDDESYSLRYKFGHELSQGFILSELLAIPRIGKHLMFAMQQPKIDSLDCLAKFQHVGELDLGTIKLIRKNDVGHLIMSNQKHLNAEDDEFNSAMECAVDLILLDPCIKTGIIRGNVMESGKYQGKRVFCSGINLTKLYDGKLSYLFYVVRELGLMNKICRGLLYNEYLGKEYYREHESYEKPWISVVDSHAIGGGCQLLLVSDFVVAESCSYFSLPAAKEGFIPGVANLRLYNYIDRRLANRMIYRNCKVAANSHDGRKIADEVVETNSMDEAIENLTDEIRHISCQGLKSNRKSIRCGIETTENFLAYMAIFCREQALCMFNMETIKNLEKTWINRYYTSNILTIPT